MEIIYVPNGKLSASQSADIDFIDKCCLSGDSSDPEAVERDMYDWGAPEGGMFVLTDGEKIVGRAAVHFSESVYDSRKFKLGGLVGLAVLSEYRGHGWGRKLAEAALDRAREIGADVACMCVDTKSGITDFYERLGFRFLGRPAYFINWADMEKTDDTVMIMGLRDAELAEHILKTDMKFSYGSCVGHW